jgi:hypothetical protein
LHCWLSSHSLEAAEKELLGSREACVSSSNVISEKTNLRQAVDDYFSCSTRCSTNGNLP